MRRRDETEPTVSLAVSADTVCFIIVKAREFDVKVAASDRDSDDDADVDIEILEDSRDDPVVQELTALIDALSEDEQVDLVAIAWLGRGDYTLRDWSSVREEAASAHNDATSRYLLGMPLLGDFLEEGLSLLGRSCGESEAVRL